MNGNKKKYKDAFHQNNQTKENIHELITSVIFNKNS